MTNVPTVLSIRLLAAMALSIFLVGCTEQTTSKPDGAAKTKSDYDGMSTKSNNTSVDESSEFTHIVTEESEYYKGGPQQAQPPDGKFKAGTKVTLIREAGSYSLVQSEDGIEAYVSTGSLKATDSPTSDNDKKGTDDKKDDKLDGPAFPPTTKKSDG